jgi:hypothetical protein
MKYYISDLQTQERILAHQVYHLPQLDQQKALSHLRKRIAKHFGLISKYDGRGQLRN